MRYGIAQRPFVQQWRIYLFVLLLAAVTIMAYRPAWNGGFLWDDDAYITNNELLAAAIFALHPVQVESVAWITERKNVLMGFFFLLTLLAWIAFTDESTRRPWRFYALAVILYALALSAKTTACTLPAALLLILWLQKKPIGKRRLIQILPFLIL